MSAYRLFHRVLAGAAALALAAATPALAENKPKDNPPPSLLAKIQIATQAPSGPGALTDLPAPPSPAPSRANDRLRSAGPATRAPTPTAWHESVLLGDIVAARKSVPHSAAPKSQANDGKYVVKGMPGRPK